ncbi:hypothetical protein Poly59_34740 [Rubripirellula reticaptiva]|uniref:Uncharacterized protein n=1 Tax=Rubripirellula reticaptiva TaxID=2528013 RepID=A0A5C6EWN9_9BACT|nr:hypothetical protein Poly59_34740 [Rubripirellula reticaptiva]
MRRNRFDTEPLYQWTGPIIELTQGAKWATPEPGKLGFGPQPDA